MSAVRAQTEHLDCSYLGLDNRTVIPGTFKRKPYAILGILYGGLSTWFGMTRKSRNTCQQQQNTSNMSVRTTSGSSVAMAKITVTYDRLVIGG
ncbi:hypothetical protein T265_11872 [Opisthorchis viverrini]|uniref:Uncharacterized protein n=1 Tax=Opisthorchis viverrini TaxID=6198 RepID=A0A074ZVV8_OPIVI|nr:hypothetical protein T265_11872 [Opisthorchis viverrini]KER19314.1 hypothetical protein T265_11872 [Opisthorchis viverrini]